MSTPIKVVGQLSLAGLMVALLGCGGASQEQEVTLESTDARLSYGIGLRMGQRMSADGMQVDVAAYAAGLEDAMTGAEAKLTDELLDESTITTINDTADNGVTPLMLACRHSSQRRPASEYSREDPQCGHKFRPLVQR